MKLRTQQRLAACYLSLTALLLSACAFTGSQATPPSQAADNAPQASVPARLFDADSHGAIVVSGDPATMRGVDREGQIVWTDELAGSTLAHAVCLRQCPDALISSNLESLRSSTVADGPPRAVMQGSAQTLEAPTTKNRILAADGASRVVATGDKQGWFIDIVNETAPVSRVRVGGWPTVWQATSDNSRALAITAKGGSTGAEVRPFVRTPSGWTLHGQPLTSETEFACASAHGGQVILSAPWPVLRDEQVSRRLPNLDAGGECSFSTSGAIIAQNALRNGAVSSRVLTVDNGGNELTTRDLSGEVRVRADARSDRVAYLNANTVVVQTLTGKILAQYADVSDARFDEAGNLVTVNKAGSAQWIPPSHLRLTK